MRAGRLRHRVALQASTQTKESAYGTVSHSWSTSATFWADEVPEGSREFPQAQQRHGELTTLFRCRYRADVARAKRLVWDSRTFDILGYWCPDSRKRELLIACREVE